MPQGMLYISKFLCSSPSHQRVHSFWDLHAVQELSMKGGQRLWDCMMVCNHYSCGYKSRRSTYPEIMVSEIVISSVKWCICVWYIKCNVLDEGPQVVQTSLGAKAGGRGCLLLSVVTQRNIVRYGQNSTTTLQLSSREPLKLLFCTVRAAELNKTKPFEKLFS